MTVLNIDHLTTCIKTLESSLLRLREAQPDSIDYANATGRGGYRHARFTSYDS